MLYCASVVVSGSACSDHYLDDFVCEYYTVVDGLFDQQFIVPKTAMQI